MVMVIIFHLPKFDTLYKGHILPLLSEATCYDGNSIGYRDFRLQEFQPLPPLLGCGVVEANHNRFPKF